MNIEKVENSEIIKLIKFALEKRNEYFTVQQACDYCNMSTSNFELVWKSIFIPTRDQEDEIHPTMEYRWVLRPEAFFSYTSFLEYKDSIVSSKKALKVATCSMILAPVISVITFVF